MRDRQCALNHDAIKCHKETDNVELCISPVYRRLAVANFLSPQCRNCSRDPDHAHLGALTHHKTKTSQVRMADPCTKFEVSSIIRCGDFTWGVKF